MRPRKNKQQISEKIEFSTGLVDNTRYIRPLAVRPLNNYERVPNPWGFFASGRSVREFLAVRGSSI